MSKSTGYASCSLIVHDCSWFFIHVQSFSLLFNDQKWWISLLFDHKIAEHLCISHHLMVRHLLHLSTGASMKQPDEGWWKTWPKVGEAEISGTHVWNSMGNLELLGGAGCAHLEKWWSSWSSSMGFGWHPFSMKWKIIHSCLKPPNRWLIIWLIVVSWCCYSQYDGKVIKFHGSKPPTWKSMGLISIMSTPDFHKPRLRLLKIGGGTISVAIKITIWGKHHKKNQPGFR